MNTQQTKTQKREYTIGEIKDLYEWLSYNVKEGYIDEDMAEELLETKNYGEIDRRREQADSYWNDPENQQT